MSKQAQLKTHYREHHANACTFRPPIIDNELLLEGDQRLQEANEQNKNIENILYTVACAIEDARFNTLEGHIEINNFYIILEERLEHLEIYAQTRELCNALTLMQFNILYEYIVKRKTLKQISDDRLCTSSNIIHHLQFIRNKAKKLKININF